MKYVVALAFMLAPTLAPAAPVIFTMACGSSAVLCTPNDFLKLTAKAQTPEESEKAWISGGVKVLIQDRDNPAAMLPDDLIALSPTVAGGERQINLRPIISPANRTSPRVLEMIYRKPSPQVSLLLVIEYPEQPNTVLPFTLDLTSVYKDAAIGLLMSEDGASCRSAALAAADCSIGAILDLRIENLAQWKSATGRDLRNLTLYLNEVPMSGVVQLANAGQVSGTAPQVISYQLKRDLANVENAKSWRELLATDPHAQLTLSAGVGIDSMRWVHAEGKSGTLVLPRYTSVPIGIAIFVAAGLIALSFTPTMRGFTSMPKSRASFLASSQIPGLQGLGVAENTFRAPWSLSMLLMALWILTVTLSFFAMFVLTQSGDLLNSTALALVGIGAGSLVFARLIDTPSEADGQIDTRLSNAITAFDPTQPATATAVKIGVAEARDAALISSNHWARDVFSEKGSNRYDLHRVQLAAFSFFYAAVFLWGLNSILALPEFSTTTLALLGISSGSYLGYKFASTQSN